MAAEAARTAPPRENGGNQDIKNFTAGTRVFYPVFVEGANLSFGDLHFSQGDGEITFCGAIEMGGFMDLHVDVIKGGMETYGVSENAIFMPGLRDPQYSEWIAFSGVSVDLQGKQHYLDSQLSYERACHHAIDYLMKFGYTDIQAYMILGSAPIEGRFSGVVDIPNSCATVYIPRRIFDFDVAPSPGKPHQVKQGDAGAEGGQLTDDGALRVPLRARRRLRHHPPAGHGAGRERVPGLHRRGAARVLVADADAACRAGSSRPSTTRRRAHESPEVVTSLPPAGRARATPMAPLTPALQRLPRP